MDEDKQDVIRMLIKELLAMPYGAVRPSGNQPTEGNSYIIVKAPDYEIKGHSGSGSDAVQVGVYTFTINCMGDSAARNCRQLNIAFRSDRAGEVLEGLGLGFISCSAGQNLTALEMDQISRWQTKLSLSFTEKLINQDIANNDNINSATLNILFEK